MPGQHVDGSNPSPLPAGSVDPYPIDKGLELRMSTMIAAQDAAKIYLYQHGAGVTDLKVVFANGTVRTIATN